MCWRDSGLSPQGYLICRASQKCSCSLQIGFLFFQRTSETFHCPLLWLSEEVVRILPCWVLMHAARAKTMLLSFASFRHIPVESCNALFYGYLDGDCCSFSWFKYLPTVVLRITASPHVFSDFSGQVEEAVCTASKKPHPLFKEAVFEMKISIKHYKSSNEQHEWKSQPPKIYDGDLFLPEHTKFLQQCLERNQTLLGLQQA